VYNLANPADDNPVHQLLVLYVNDMKIDNKHTQIATTYCVFQTQCMRILIIENFEAIMLLCSIFELEMDYDETRGK
jgi:hypothetical protein